MKSVLIFLLIAFSALFCFSGETKSDSTGDSIVKDNGIIEFIYGKGLIKNGKRIFKNNEMVNALSPVPQALMLFRKSQAYFAAGFTFMGIGLAVGTAETVLGLVFSFYHVTDLEYSYYQIGNAFLSSIDGLSGLLFFIYIVVGIVMRYNSVLIYNTAIMKNSNKEISLAPIIDYKEKSVFLGIKIGV